MLQVDILALRGLGSTPCSRLWVARGWNRKLNFLVGVNIFLHRDIRIIYPFPTSPSSVLHAFQAASAARAKEQGAKLEHGLSCSRASQRLRSSFAILSIFWGMFGILELVTFWGMLGILDLFCPKTLHNMCRICSGHLRDVNLNTCWLCLGMLLTRIPNPKP